jgi:hypothetical protein
MNHSIEPDDVIDLTEMERERELLLDELARDSENFARSSEDGWFYSDDD